MNKSCPNKFPANLVGSLPDWPATESNILENCQGSAGMAGCIHDNVGGIGYIDAGHGLGAGLPEVRLPKTTTTVADAVTPGDNDNAFWTSQEAVVDGGIQQAERNILPAAATADFGAVTLINRPGGAWPMVQLTYLYVRKDLSFMASPEERGLLIAFVKALYDTDYVTICQEEYGFMLPSDEIRQFGLDAVAELESAADATEWTFEQGTQAVVGTGDFVLSAKRQSVGSLERDRNADEVGYLVGQVAALETKLQAAVSSVSAMEKKLQESQDQVNEMNNMLAGGGDGSTTFEIVGDFTDQDETQLTAALTMAAMSFIAWVAFGLFYACRFFYKP